jgi:hypothetical protein
MTDTTNPQAAWPPAVRDAFWTAVNAPTYDESTAATLAFAQLLTTSTVPASAPTDWAAILRAEAEHLIRDLYPAVYDDAGQKTAQGVNRAARELLDRADDAELRRLADAVPVSGPGGAADETQQPEAHADFQDRGEAARQAAGIDGTAGDAQDVPHAFVLDEPTGGCLLCGLSPTYRKHQPAAVPAPPVEHCIHDRTVHRTHHKAPVTGCPWCATAEQAAGDPS